MVKENNNVIGFIIDGALHAKVMLNIKKSKMKIGLSIILLFVCSSLRLFSQDSLKVNSVLDAKNEIFYSFLVINSRIDPVLKDKFQQLVKSKNKLGKLESKMYIFNFIMEFDSCGQFVSCRNEKVKYGNRKLNSISRDISKLISASGFEVKNTVLLSGSVYQIYKYGIIGYIERRAERRRQRQDRLINIIQDTF